MIDFDSTILNYKHFLERLLSSKALPLVTVVQNKPFEFNVEGVYVISTPDDSKVVYVGKTRKLTVIGRMFDHRNTGTTSDLRGMLKLFSNYPQERDSYLIRCLEVENERNRALLEHFVISVIDPPFNK
jgi:hypothetical protein